MRAQYAGTDGNAYRYHNGLAGIEEDKRKPSKTKLDLDFEIVLAFFNRLMNPGN